MAPIEEVVFWSDIEDTHGGMAQIKASFSGEGAGSQAHAGRARVSQGGYVHLLGRVHLSRANGHNSREWLVMGSNSPVGVKAEPYRFKPNVRPRSRTPSQQRVVRILQQIRVLCIPS